ncbi:MAG: UDP-N-acetylmuramoyl-L-alanyl-D-glutamate--2,6-diaminopimelate ligase [Steroidobacteraceae bacterium]
MTATRSLADLCRGYADAPSLPIRHISLDSRRVEADGLFLACAGRRTHGLRGLGEACSRGARAILWEPAAGVEPPTPRDDIFMAPVSELSRHASAIAARFHGDPSLTLAVAGVTGTNGKTTTSWLIAMAMQQQHRRAGYIGTLGCGVPGEALVGGEYTTEDAVSVQQRLADLLTSKAECVAMEVSSHALDQFRVESVRYRVVAFTNLTRDHLDYHGTMENYAAAKARLFDLSRTGARVINVDDAQGAKWALQQASLGEAPLFVTARTDTGRAVAEQCAALDTATVRISASDIERHVRGLRFRLLDSSVDPQGSEAAALEIPLIGEFNVDNVLIAYGVLRAFGMTAEDARRALSSSQSPPGRMEAFVIDSGALAIVDYAHTPDALAKALVAARAHCARRLHLVFGCGGDRDVGKRPMMGEIAGRLADQVVITDDNPRTEDPAQIIAEIRRGVGAEATIAIQHDRAAAIREALMAARDGDVVLIAGKGHEDYQLVGREKRPFSDQMIVKEFIRQVAV